MTDLLIQAVNTNSAALFSVVANVVQFSVIIYMGKYILHGTVSKEAFHALADKLYEIADTVKSTNQYVKDR